MMNFRGYSKLYNMMMSKATRTVSEITIAPSRITITTQPPK